MNFWSTPRGALTMIVSSMGLLAVFIGIWLSSVYEDEQAAFQKESGFLFYKVINDMESDYFQEIIQKTLNQPFGEPIVLMNKKLTIASSVDTLNTFINSDSLKQDTSIRIHFDLSDSKNPRLSKGIFLNKKFPEELNQEAAIFSPDSIFIDEVHSIFTAVLDESNLPKSYRIIKVEDTDTTSTIAVTSKFKDWINGDQYLLTMDDYQPYLLKRMLPEFGFSLLLFSSIGLAFFMVYKSLLKQQRLNEIKKDFVNNITHELKTPITTVGVAMEALSNFNESQDPQKTKEYINISKQELNRLSLLVDKVLTINEFDQREPTLKIENLNIQHLLDQITNSLQLQLEKHNAKLDFTTQGNDFDIEGDRMHLSNVFYNLIDNALKYSKQNPKIQLGLFSQNRSINITVTDTGIGIPLPYQDKIFEKFFRVPTGDVHNIKGHGLGLSYVASVIKKHHGNIELRSEKDVGTQFIIELPKKHEEN